MKLRYLIRAADDAGLRPREITQGCWQLVCPACWPQTQGGKYLTITGDPWPDVLCMNPACPTNSDAAHQDTAVQIRAAVHGHPVIDTTSALSHLIRLLGARHVARLLRTPTPEKTAPARRRYQAARPAPRPARTLP